MAAIDEIPKPDFLDEETWNALIATRDHNIIRAASRGHVQAYLDTGGGDGTFLTQGGPTLLLGTTGRRSGTEQISPCNFMEDGENVVVVGSVAGLDRHPHWVLNLDAEPKCWVQVKDKRWNAIARLVEGEEKKALWPRLVDFFPLWGHFQKYCDREFKTYIVSPREEA